MDGSWSRHFSEESQRWFYFNSQTEQSMWEDELPRPELPPAPTDSYVTQDLATQMNSVSVADTPQNVQGVEPPWEVLLDETSSRTYYHNTVTGITSWDPPTPTQHPPPPPPPPPIEPSPSLVYERYVDPSCNREYYVNVATQEPSWHLPEGATVASPQPHPADVSFQSAQKSQLESPQPRPSVDNLGRPKSASQFWTLEQVRRSVSMSISTTQPRLSIGSVDRNIVNAAHGDMRERAMSEANMKRRMLPAQLLQDLHKFQYRDFAHRYFATHRTGIFLRRTVPPDETMKWQNTPLKFALLRSTASEKPAKELFKDIQEFMGDRPRKLDPDHIATIIVKTGRENLDLRDELFAQIRKQCTDNPNRVSTLRGWALMAMCCAVFGPTQSLYDYLRYDLGQVTVKEVPDESDMAFYAFNALEFANTTPLITGNFTTLHARVYSSPTFMRSQMGIGLEELMMKQVRTFPDEKDVPYILKYLIDLILKLEGQSREGIFRVGADETSVERCKTRLLMGEYSLDSTDANVPAFLLKFWFRELPEPIIPEDKYQDCVNASSDPDRAVAIIRSLSPINRNTLVYLCKFLRDFSRKEVVAQTKMTSENLALVFSPNLLKLTNITAERLYKDASRCQQFVVLLIKHLE